MIEQLKTIREDAEWINNCNTGGMLQGRARNILEALTQLEAMAGQEPVAWMNPKTGTAISDKEKTMWRNRCGGINSQGTNDDNMKAYAAAHTEPCFAAPVAQQHVPEADCGNIKAQQPQADSIPVAAFDRLMALCESQAQRIIELEDKQPQAEAVPPDVEVIRKALERAFIMGQNYWADADSESYSANKRSDVTRQKFNAMRDEVCAAIAQQKGQP